MMYETNRNKSQMPFPQGYTMKDIDLSLKNCLYNNLWHRKISLDWSEFWPYDDVMNILNLMVQGTNREIN